MDMFSKYRHYLLTINNPLEHGYTRERIIEIADMMKPKYYCMAEENCPTTGTHHLHLYLWLWIGEKWERIRQTFKNFHIEIVNGSAQSNIDYVRKTGAKWENSEKGKNSRIDGTFYEKGYLTDAERYERAYDNDRRGNADMRELQIKVDKILSLLSG
jgi:hypothetical protein